jgi:hypothetical protein
MHASYPAQDDMKKKLKRGIVYTILVRWAAIAQTLLSLATLILLSDTRCSYFDARSADSCRQKWGKSFPTIFH